MTELFNVTVEMAKVRGLLSGEHVSVDGTLIQAWAVHKSIRRKNGSDDDRPPENWHGEKRSNDTHESKTDLDSLLYRKSNAAPALLSYLGHVLTDNRHGLVVNVHTTQADGKAEHAAAGVMLGDVRSNTQRITVGADKAYDTRGSSRNAAPSISPRTWPRTSSAMAAAPSTPARRRTTLTTLTTLSANSSANASSSASTGESQLARYATEPLRKAVASVLSEHLDHEAG